MVQTLVALVIAPLLTAAATVAARRRGPRLGGVVSAFPAIVGPVLLIAALAHGRAFAGHVAQGTVLGLVGLSAFSFVYGAMAGPGGRGWGACLGGAWVAAALASTAAGLVAGGSGPLAGAAALVVAAASLALAHRGIARFSAAVPAPAARAPVADRRPGIPVRMALTATLVLALSAAAGAVGAVAGGILAALPVLASILAVLTHRDAGGAAAAVLLRGMLAGMAGFVVFCEAVAVLVTHAAVAATFAAATAAALLVQAWVAHGRLSPGLPAR